MFSKAPEINQRDCNPFVEDYATSYTEAHPGNWVKQYGTASGSESVNQRGTHYNFTREASAPGTV